MNTKQKALTIIALVVFGAIIIGGRSNDNIMRLTWSERGQGSDAPWAVKTQSWGLTFTGMELLALAVGYGGLFFVLGDRRKQQGGDK